MQTRLRRVERILHVQERMHRVAEAELARVARRAQEVAEQRRLMVQALGEISPFHGLFQVSTARTLAALAVDEDRLRSDHASRSRALLASATRRKQIAHRVDDLRAECDKEAEKRAWLDRLDGLRFAARSGGPVRD
jgi:hypothetical protein